MRQVRLIAVTVACMVLAAGCTLQAPDPVVTTVTETQVVYVEPDINYEGALQDAFERFLAENYPDPTGGGGGGPVPDGWTPPDDDGWTPPEDDGWTPPEDDGWTPPEDDGWTPPEDDGWTPPEDDGWTPPEDDGWSPPEDDGWSPPEDDGWTPPVEGPPELVITLDFDNPTLSQFALVEPVVTGGAAVLGVEFYVDDFRIDTDFIPPYNILLNTAEYKDGLHNITVYTADNAGQTANASVNIVFDNTPPQFVETTPGPDEVLFLEDGPLTMTAITEDVNPIELMTFRANGLLVGEVDTEPFSATIAFEDLYITEDDPFPQTLLLQFIAKDQLGQTTEVGHNVQIWRRQTWSFDTFGEIWGSPVATNNGIFLANAPIPQTGGEGDQKDNLFQLDANGQEQWSVHQGLNVFASPGYAPDHDYRFVSTLDDNIYALNSGGGVAWSANPGSPTIAGLEVLGGSVFAATFNGRVVAYNTSNGGLQWQHDTGAIFNTPGIAISAEGVVYVGGEDSFVYAVGPGGVQWAKETGGEIQCQPAVGTDGSVYMGSDDGWVYAVQSNGVDQWSSQLSGPVRGRIAITDDDGVIAATDVFDDVYKLNPLTGEQMWKAPLTALGFSGPTVGPDNTIYLGSDLGVVFALDGETGDLLWSMQVADDTIYGAPLISGSFLYVGSWDRALHSVRIAP